MDTEKEPIVGMNTDGFEDEFFQRTTVNHLFARTRVADKKMVFLPIPRAELRKVPLMDRIRVGIINGNYKLKFDMRMKSITKYMMYCAVLMD